MHIVVIQYIYNIRTYVHRIISFRSTVYRQFRRKIRLIEGNANSKGTLRQAFICLRPRTPYPPLHTVLTDCFAWISETIKGRMVLYAGIFKQSMGARNRVRIWLSYRPAKLHGLVELVPWNRILGSLKV
jgi:hypothetical protein